MKDFAFGTLLLVIAAALVASLLFGIIFGWQKIRVYVAETGGRAEYARAEQNRKIVILEAQAANESATQNAEATIKIETAKATAEIERAKGVAEANRIIGDSLKGNEDYLRYLYINGLTSGAGQIIYVPTEAGLPILEARNR